MKSAMTIRQTMTPRPVTVKVQDKIGDIIELLSLVGFEHLPVVDKNRKLVGMLSKTDLYKKVNNLAHNTSGKEYTNKILVNSEAKEIMTPNPVYILPEQSIDYAVELLLQGEFHALPVIDNGEVIGIITSKDILEFLIDSKLLVHAK